jgi:hypothetical protein
MFIIAGLFGVVVTLLARSSRSYRQLAAPEAQATDVDADAEPGTDATPVPVPAAA